MSSRRRLSICIGFCKIGGHVAGVVVVAVVVEVVAGILVVRVVVVVVVVDVFFVVTRVVCSSAVTGAMELEIKSVKLKYSE